LHETVIHSNAFICSQYKFRLLYIHICKDSECCKHQSQANDTALNSSGVTELLNDIRYVDVVMNLAAEFWISLENMNSTQTSECHYETSDNGDIVGIPVDFSSSVKLSECQVEENEK